MSNIVFFLYADNPTIVNGGKVNDMSAVRNTDSYRLLEQKESGGLFFVYEKGVAGLSDERHMIYMKKLDFYSSDIEKVLKIEFNYGSMMRTFKNMNYDNEVLICHGDDIVLSNGAYSGVNKPFKTLEAIGKISDSVYRQKLSLYGCDLDIYVFKTRSNIWSMLMHNAPIIVFLMLINVFFPLCLFSIFNHSFTSRILQLSKVFKSVDSEKLVSMTDRESKDEIGSMIKNYNRMVSRTNDLIQTVYKNKLKEQEMLVSQKNAELLALHSQINPHFLFNALESIRMHSLLKKENETADMVEKLAIMQRQYVEWGNDAVTVAKECEFVKAYLALQKYRFGEQLNYNIDIEADCMECQVPKLTLVTFVENACVHGIESKAAPGWIFVRIFKKAGFMHIEVEDTGSGIDPDALEKMKSNMKNADIDMLKTGGRVGVINACMRIKMVTESKAVFDVDSEEGCGTTVMIKNTGNIFIGRFKMLKVLLVDDEPFIIQGLKVIIDWENEEFEIAGTASNGKEALQFLENENVDLVIADIRMPEMTGLELLETLRKDKKSDVYFVILSGYADFSYAQQAMQNDCTDYILKPVDKEMLLKVLNKVLVLKNEKNQINEDNKKMKQAYLARHLISLIQGKYDEVNLNYVKENMRCEGGARYVEIQMEQLPAGDEILDSDMRSLQRKMYESCVAFLGADSAHCVFDVSVNEKVYDIGFIFSDYMAEEAAKTERKYLEDLRRYICDNTQKNIVMLVGRKVSDISKIARSYGNACMLRSFQGFRIVKSIYYYEDEVKISADGIVLCKDSLDKLLRTVEQNNHLEIRNAVAKFYDEMSSMGMNGESMNLNINYLLFQFIHLASEQDDNVNQQEILRLISESSFKTGIERGSRAHMTRFCCEYGDYLSQLRKNVSRGVIGMVEKEVRDNYATNITLKSLSEKYYVNSAYLGQLFRKKYGQSFKDYLNNYRMERAAELLLRTDKKIIQIAEKVGYHDMDYFVKRFIQVKGCTPARFRRQMQSGE